MSLDRIDSKTGLLSLLPLATTGGFPGGAFVGGEAGFAPGLAVQTGGALIQGPTPRSGVSTTLATSGTITHNNSGVAKVTNAGAITANIIQAGSYDGQYLTVTNEGTGSITMAVAATSNVLSGTGAVIAALGAATFVWNTTNARWHKVA